MRPIRGWLLVYLIALAGLAAHGLELTIAALIVGVHLVPGPAIAFYVVTNAVLILYTVLLYVLMLGRKHAAIAHNVVFHVLSIVFLVSWHAFHMKSPVGVAIDIVPNIVMAGYILTSRRVRQTFGRAGTARRGYRPDRPGRSAGHPGR